jgi:fumarylacetoacetate (FAA) hydrolase
MKLVTFSQGTRQKLGVATAAGIIDLSILNSELDIPMNEFLLHSKELTPLAERILNGEVTLPAHALLPEAATHLLAPVPHPPSVRDGYAFRQHVETARKNRGLAMIPEFDSFPVFYFTNHQAIIGQGDLRVGGRRLEQLDYELEIAAVIGREVRNPSIAEADDAIFGFTIMNDFSARALQMEEMKLNLGPAKGKDFATALGPWLVTKDELVRRIDGSPRGNVLHAKMTASINGEKMSEGNAEQMNWTFAQIIARAADGVTLHPGDVIGSGTVGTGCLLELNGSKVTDNRWLQPGDEISLSVDGLGTLTNKIVEDSTC